VSGTCAMAKRIAYHVITYGEWTRPRLRNFREQCCDCGLIHRLDAVKKKLQIFSTFALMRSW
jgi:hypothetical protein